MDSRTAIFVINHSEKRYG